MINRQIPDRSTTDHIKKPWQMFTILNLDRHANIKQHLIRQTLKHFVRQIPPEHDPDSLLPKLVEINLIQLSSVYVYRSIRLI